MYLQYTSLTQLKTWLTWALPPLFLMSQQSLKHLLIPQNQTKQVYAEFPLIIQKAFLEENMVIKANQKVEVSDHKFEEPSRPLCVLNSVLVCSQYYIKPLEIFPLIGTGQGYINLLGENILLLEGELFEFTVTSSMYVYISKERP